MALDTAKKNKQKQRREAQRSGSRETVELIFEATARILAAHGRAGLNTNRIAEVAGVSIGSLYGYFPNKQAILLAMARRELDHLRDRVKVALAPAPGDSPIDPARRAIRALIKGYTARGRVRRILMETLFSMGGHEEMARPVSEVAELLRGRAGDLLPAEAPSPSEMRLYVLTRAVDNTIRTASYENIDFLHSTAFEDELVRLVRVYFLEP
ncbi:MAG: TetR/AcrR family transcriptional regulator [Terricaulis sp.]